MASYVREKLIARRAANDTLEERAIFLEAAARPGAHDPNVFEALGSKVLGVLLVQLNTFDFAYDGPDIQWNCNDTYLNIWLPSIGKDNLTFAAIAHSYKLVAMYAAAQNLEQYGAKAIGSLTNARFAHIAKHSFGFEIADVAPDQLPQHSLQSATTTYNRFVNPDGTKQPFEPGFIYQPLAVAEAIGAKALAEQMARWTQSDAQYN